MSALSWAQQFIDTHGDTLPPECVEFLSSQIVELEKEPVDVAPLPPDPKKPTIIRDRKGLEKAASELAIDVELAFDIETAGLDPLRGEIVGLGFATGELAYYVPTGHRFQADGSLLPDQLQVSTVARALKLAERRMIAHNAKFELRWLRRHAGIECHFIWDTMLGAALLRSDLSAKLKDAGPRELDVPDWSLPKDEMKNMQFLPVPRVADYCAADCYYTFLLYRKQIRCLASNT